MLSACLIAQVDAGFTQGMTGEVKTPPRLLNSLKAKTAIECDRGSYIPVLGYGVYEYRLSGAAANSPGDCLHFPDQTGENPEPRTSVRDPNVASSRSSVQSWVEDVTTAFSSQPLREKLGCQAHLHLLCINGVKPRSRKTPPRSSPSKPIWASPGLTSR